MNESFELEMRKHLAQGNSEVITQGKNSTPTKVENKMCISGVGGSPGNFGRPLVVGMVFPNFEVLEAYVYNWGRVNSSLLVSCGFHYKSNQHHGFHCPHKVKGPK